MKKAITYRLCIVIVLSMVIVTIVSYYIQIGSANDLLNANSKLRLDQIAQVLEKNTTELEQLKENLKEDYFIRAKAAAYIIENNPGVVGNLEEIRKIAALLQVDEIHLFDKNGMIYDGSEPKYYGYTFDSGEQMQFFLPMLTDDSLQLCQDVTPNTAESKKMQYVAVWREDHKGIIQIGMEPTRLIEAMDKNDLAHIFSVMTAEQGITIFAADPQTDVILGSTDADLTGMKMKELGINVKDFQGQNEGITAEIDGESYYCIIQKTEQALLVICSTYDTLYQNIPASMALIIISLCLLSFIIIFIILKMLDYFIIHRIYKLIECMKKISNGDLDCKVEVAGLKEFEELSANINSMVLSLLETTGKLSLVFQNVNIPIAVYEYNLDMKRVLATSKIGDILKLEEVELCKLLEDRNLFFLKINQLCSNPHAQEKDVYILEADRPCFVKFKSYQEDRKTLGILVDVTDETLEKQKIKMERDIDHLTGLASRRAFYAEMDQLFQHTEQLKIAAFLMVDLDNLKYVNDSWGHEYGDKLLKKAAELLSECPAHHKITARLGGDEFAIFIYGAASEQEIQEWLDFLYGQINKAYIHVPDQDTFCVRMSGGYVFYPKIIGGYCELLRYADQAMYQVKKNSKGYFAKYSLAEDKNA